MAGKSWLTVASEISQIVALVVAMLALLAAFGQWPGWLSMPGAETLSALSRILIALTAVTLSIAVLLGLLRVRSVEREWSQTQDNTQETINAAVRDMDNVIRTRCAVEAQDAVQQRVESALASITRGPSDPLIVVAASAQTTTVRLGEREFDLGPGAHEFYKRQPPENQEKLLRLMRRVTMFNKTRWTKEDFVVEVDEKQRVSIKLGHFLEEGDKLNGELHLETLQRKLKKLEAEVKDPKIAAFQSALAQALVARPMPFLELPDYTLGRMRADAEEWRRKVTEFLKAEKPGLASEFAMSIAPPTEQLSDLERVEHDMGVLLTRLIKIKERAETP